MKEMDDVIDVVKEAEKMNAANKEESKKDPEEVKDEKKDSDKQPEKEVKADKKEADKKPEKETKDEKKEAEKNPDVSNKALTQSKRIAEAKEAAQKAKEQQPKPGRLNQRAKRKA